MTEKRLPPLLRALLISFCLLALLAVYLFQKTDYSSWLFAGALGSNEVFIFNKTIRLVANDLLCVLLIFAIFQEKKYLKVAFLVFLFELFIVMPFYFILKLKMEGDSEISSPFLSQIHRLIVNPMLMFILLVGFYYQKYWLNKKQ